MLVVHYSHHLAIVFITYRWLRQLLCVCFFLFYILMSNMFSSQRIIHIVIWLQTMVGTLRFIVNLILHWYLFTSITLICFQQSHAVWALILQSMDMLPVFTSCKYSKNLYILCHSFLFSMITKSSIYCIWLIHFYFHSTQTYHLNSNVYG